MSGIKKTHKGHYHKDTKVPTSENVGRFLKAVSRRFMERRPELDNIVKHYLKKYHIVGTSTEDYWRLKGLCILLGRESPYLNSKRKD